MMREALQNQVHKFLGCEEIGTTCALEDWHPSSSGEGDAFCMGSRFAHQLDMLSASFVMLVPALLAESLMLCIPRSAVNGQGICSAKHREVYAKHRMMIEFCSKGSWLCWRGSRSSVLRSQHHG